MRPAKFATETARPAIAGAEGRRMTTAAPHRGRKTMAALLGLYFLFFLVQAIVAERGLAADGAYFFLWILERRTVITPEWWRWTANALTQWPLLAGLWFGITDFRLLAWLHGFGLYDLAPVTLGLCWLLLPAERKGLFVFPLLSLLFGWMASCFAAISTAPFLALWFWPTAFALLFCRPEERRHAAVIVLLALPTILLHEGMSYLGLLLAGLAGRRARQAPGGAARLVWHAAALWFLAGAAIGIWFTLFPLSTVARNRFIRDIAELWFLGRGHAVNHPIVAAAIGAALLWFCQRFDRLAERTFALWFPPAALGLALLGLAPIVLPASFDARLQLEARAWTALVPIPLFLVTIAVLAGRLRVLAVVRPASMRVIAAVAFAQITWQVAATAQWSGYVDVLRGELARGAGLIPYEGSALARPRSGVQVLGRINPEWANSSLSIALAPQGHVRSVLAAPADARWVPFDPRRPEQLPRIEGFDYGEYLDALR